MTEAAIRPPVPYFGGKMRLAKRLIDLFPAHRHYVEAYAGSLAVLLPKPRAPHETVNDLDGDLVNFWRVLRESPDELARVCALTPHAREEHRESYRPAARDHADLLEAVTAANASVVISSYANPMYDGALFDWHRREINTNTGQGGTWSKRVEVVWSNRPFPTTPNPEGARPA